MLKSISNSANSVSLHVRRGDYANNQEVKAFHGLLPYRYYEEALASLGVKPNHEIFVFSDDLEWASHSFPPGRFTIIDRSVATSAAGDLRLMASCDAHVIANSSFSWWGAWLDARTPSKVVSPERWFAKGGLDTSDLLPDHWERLRVPPSSA
jgi:hypothetical protein